MAELKDLFGTGDPDEYRKKLAAALVQQGLDSSPIRSGWQGAARMAQALVGTMQMNNLQDEATGDLLKQSNALRTSSDLPALTQFDGAKSNDSLVGRLASALRGGDASPAAPSQSPTQTPQPASVATTDMNLPRGFRNNNPGNIEASPWTQSQPGFVGVEPKGRFAQFDTMDNGMGAMGNLVGNYANKGIDSIKGIISRWAPTSDGNNVANYAATVGRQVGIDPNARIDLNDPAIRQKITAAMAQFENGRPVPMGGQGALPPGAQPTAFQGQPQQPMPAPQGGPQGASIPGQAPNMGMAQMAPQQAPQGGAGMPQPDPSLMMPQSVQAPQMAAPQAPQGQGAPGQRALPQMPPEYARHIDELSRLGTKAGLQQAQLLRDTFQKKALDQVRPLTDPTERARMGIQPTDTNPYQIDATGKITAINPQPFNVNVNNQAESEFAKKAGEVQAKRFDELAGEAPKAKQMVSDIGVLRELGSNIGTGKMAQVKAVIGPYADALGVKVDGLNEIQAYEAIVNRMAPQLRVAGTGAQSDFELRNFMKSLPSLGNTPDGNALIERTVQGLYQNKIAAAEIGSNALTGEISRKEAEKRIRELPDPMEEWRKATKGQGGAASAQPEPTGGPRVKRYNPQTGNFE